MQQVEAIYARQSLVKKNSLSIEGQIELCKKYANDPENCRVYFESKSGKNTTEREQFQNLIDDVKSGLISTVIVYRIDRISRKVSDFCAIWDIFKQYHVKFISCNEKFDTSTPAGEGMLMILMVFAQMERSATIERVKDNYFSRAELGYYLGGVPPYGYQKTEITLHGKKTSMLVQDENEAEVIRKIYKMYAETTKSIGKVGYQLTEQGYRTRKDSNWSTCNLGRVMRNPVYVRANSKVYQYLQAKGATMNNEVDDYIGVNGCYVYSQQYESSNPSAKKKCRGRTNYNMDKAYVTLAPHEGIVDADLWLKCQYKLDNNKQIKCDRSGTHTWLSGIMRCENCGYGITVVNNNRGKNYINCYGRKIHACNGRAYAWQLFEIEDIAKKLFFEHLEKLDNLQAKESIPEEPPEVEEYRKQIIKLENKIDNLMDELEIAKEEKATHRITSLRKRLDTHSESLKNLNLKISEILNNNYNRKKNLTTNYTIKYIIQNWDTNTFDIKEKQKIARSFIQHVIIGDKNVTVVFY